MEEAQACIAEAGSIFPVSYMVSYMVGFVLTLSLLYPHTFHSALLLRSRGSNERPNGVMWLHVGVVEEPPPPYGGLTQGVGLLTHGVRQPITWRGLHGLYAETVWTTCLGHNSSVSRSARPDTREVLLTWSLVVIIVPIP